MKTQLKYITVILVIFLLPFFLTPQIFGAVIAKPTDSIVVVDGKSITFEAYNINASSTGKL